MNKRGNFDFLLIVRVEWGGGDEEFGLVVTYLAVRVHVVDVHIADTWYADVVVQVVHVFLVLHILVDLFAMQASIKLVNMAGQVDGLLSTDFPRESIEHLHLDVLSRQPIEMFLETERYKSDHVVK